MPSNLPGQTDVDDDASATNQIVGPPRPDEIGENEELEQIGPGESTATPSWTQF